MGCQSCFLCKLTSVALAACDLSYQGMRLWRQLVAGPRAAGRSDGRGGGRGRPQLSTVPREHGKAGGSTGRGWPGDPSGRTAAVRCDPCVCFRGRTLVACPPEGCVLQRGPRGRPRATSERAAAGHPAPDQGRNRQSLLSQVSQSPDRQVLPSPGWVSSPGDCPGLMSRELGRRPLPGRR